MGEIGTLTRNQARFIGALGQAGTIREAATLADVSESTAWRYLATPAVRAALAERQGAILAAATTGLVADMAAARSELVSVMRDDETAPGVRVRAAATVLQFGAKLFELVALASRVAELEAQVDALVQKGGA